MVARLAAQLIVCCLEYKIKRTNTAEVFLVFICVGLRRVRKNRLNTGWF